MSKFEAPRGVSITRSRWRVVIDVTDASGEVHTFIASADAYYTGHDGIWFGTEQEYDEYE